MKRLFGLAFALIVLAGCFPPPELPKSPAPPLDTIAYLRAGDVWSMREDGSLQTQLTNTPEEERSPELAHNGTRILFARAERVWSMKRDGTDATQLTFGLRDTFPAWSPDDSQVAFIREDLLTGFGVWVVNLDGSGAHRVISLFEPRFSDPAWAPDGSTIAYTFNLSCCADHILFVTPSGLSAGTFIGPLSGLDQVTFDMEASWAPDSSRIAFRGQLEVDGPAGVWTATRGGGRGSAVFLTDGATPSWSPGGDQIAFARGGEVWKMAEDGSGQVALGTGSEPSWGPTG